jgi:cytochrome c553
MFEEMSMKRRGERVLHRVCMLLAGLVAVTASVANAAQPDASSDLRAAYATPQDVAEGKRVAEASCASCHGINGIARNKDVPNIAGQRPAYLNLELRAYQSGSRGNTPMNNVVKFLSDDALFKVAAYYANLDPAQPAPAAKTKGRASPADPLAAGKAAASGCAGCHGDTGVSKTPGMPSLAGLDPKYVVAAITAYKSGQRKNDMMKTLVSALNEADINNIALFYATQKPAKTPNPAPGNQAAGKAAATACAGCHGETGVSTSTAPSLAGQDTQYVQAAVRAYKDGSRNDAMMKAPAASTDENTLKDIAAYYANQEPQAPSVRRPLTIIEITQRCNRCHGVDGNSTDPRIPALASQRPDYIEKSIRAYQKGERKSTAMAAMVDGLSDADIEGLANHYARQRARTVVYVPLPAK